MVNPVLVYTALATETPAQLLDMTDMEWQKQEFYQLLDEHIEKLNEHNRNSFIVNQEIYDQAVAADQLDKGVKCAQGNNFKFLCVKHFS